jgi:hypothetical protein
MDTWNVAGLRERDETDSIMFDEPEWHGCRVKRAFHYLDFLGPRAVGLSA